MLKTCIERLQDEVDYYLTVLEEKYYDIGFYKGQLLSICHWIDNYSCRHDRDMCSYFHGKYREVKTNFAR